MLVLDSLAAAANVTFGPTPRILTHAVYQSCRIQTHLEAWPRVDELVAPSLRTAQALSMLARHTSHFDINSIEGLPAVVEAARKIREQAYDNSLNAMTGRLKVISEIVQRREKDIDPEGYGSFGIHPDRDSPNFYFEISFAIKRIPNIVVHLKKYC